MIQDIFETLGFKEEDMKAYLGLLDGGARTAGDLSKTLGVPRPTLYGQLERLVAAGLAREDMTRGVKVFAPEPVERLRALYRNKIRDLRIKEKSLDTIIPELESRNAATLLRPQLVPFNGRKELRGALEDLLSAKQNLITACLLPMRTLMEATTPEFMRYHARERIRRGINMRGLWSRNQGVDISAHPHLAWGPEFRSELRYAALGTEITLGYWVYGHKTLFIAPDCLSGYRIDSADMAEMMNAQHHTLWKNADPVPFDRRVANGFIAEIGKAANAA